MPRKWQRKHWRVIFLGPMHPSYVGNCWSRVQSDRFAWHFFSQAWSRDGHSTARSIFNFWMQAIYLIAQSLFVPCAQLDEATFCYVAFMHSENVEMVEESCLGLLRSLAAKMGRIHVTHGPWRELCWDREGSSNATAMVAQLQDQVSNLSFSPFALHFEHDCVSNVYYVCVNSRGLHDDTLYHGMTLPAWQQFVAQLGVAASVDASVAPQYQMCRSHW